MLQPLMRRTWAPRGQTPVMDAWDRHDRLTAITALALSPQRRRISLYFELLDHNATATDFLGFLLRLRDELKRPLWVIWDRLGAHRKAARLLEDVGAAWLNFTFLPAYCPELNPVEHVWSTTKWGALANWPAPNLEAMGERVGESFDNQADSQATLRGHFRWAELDL